MSLLWKENSQLIKISMKRSELKESNDELKTRKHKVQQLSLQRKLSDLKACLICHDQQRHIAKLLLQIYLMHKIGLILIFTSCLLFFKSMREKRDFQTLSIFITKNREIYLNQRCRWSFTMKAKLSTCLILWSKLWINFSLDRLKKKNSRKLLMKFTHEEW